MAKGKEKLATSRPDLLEEWDYQKNADLDIDPETIGAGSHEKAWWICKNGHSWCAEIRGRAIRGYSCPYCLNKRRLSGVNDFATKFPELLAEWDYERNEVKPSELMPSSHKKVWWTCSDCGEKWQAEVSNRTAGSGCPRCGQTKRSSGRKTAPYNRSVACLYPKLIEEWDYKHNSQINPEKTYPGSDQIAWWICPKCNQHYQASIGNRVKGAACPVCAGKVIVSGINDLETWCKDNDRQYILDEWDYKKNNVLPSEVAPFASKKIWFVCKQGHAYRSLLANKTKLHTGCPICNKIGTSFQEQACAYYLEKYYSNVINSYHDEWLGKLELDIYLPELKCAVEYDGVEWHKDSKKALLKNNLCKENGVQLIRIREEGLPSLQDCINIIVENRSSQTLNKAIEKLLITLGKKEKYEVDVDRDTSKIIERFDFKKKENSIAIRFPELLEEWDYEKNGSVAPDYINYGSVRKYWWICSQCGNHFLMSPNYRTYQKQGCPICAKSKRVSARIAYHINHEGSLATRIPELLEEWDYDKNELPPESYLLNSKQKVWWKCSRCGGRWQARIQNRTKQNGTGCPYCAGKRKQTIIGGDNIN